jgi:hypothetical protein
MPAEVRSTRWTNFLRTDAFRGIPCLWRCQGSAWQQPGSPLAMPKDRSGGTGDQADGARDQACRAGDTQRDMGGTVPRKKMLAGGRMTAKFADLRGRRRLPPAAGTGC